MQDDEAHHIWWHRDGRFSLHKALGDYTGYSYSVAVFRRSRTAWNRQRYLPCLKPQVVVYADLGKKVELKIHPDATAAISIAKRRGLGKLRRLDCEDLWIQAKVRNKEVKLVKVLETSNPADILTKDHDQKTLQSALATTSMRPEAGRPESAPAAAH